MAAGDAPAPACPLEPVRLEPHARPVGVPVDGPLATEQRLHVVLGQIVRRRLRAAHGADLPGARIDGPGVRAKPAAAVTVRAGRSERQSVARLQRPAVEASERTHGVRGTRAEQRRYVEAAVGRQVEPKPGTRRDADPDHRSGGNAPALPRREGPAVCGQLRIGAADRNRRVGVQAEGEVAERDLERRRRLGIADEEVRGTQSEVVHRARREEALGEHPAPTGIVLDRRLDPGFDHFGGSHGTGVAAAASSRLRLCSAASPLTEAAHSR